MVNLLYSNSQLMLERAMNFQWTKQTAINDNIVNAETPNYKAKYVTFEEELGRRISEVNQVRRHQKRAVSDAIDRSRSWLNTTWDESSRLDGNNVDMDQEQVELVRTAYEYQFLLNSFTNDITRLKNAAKAF